MRTQICLIRKTEKSRKFLSDLKSLTTKFNDLSFTSISQTVEKFHKDNGVKVLFLHIREPDEIEKAVRAFNAKTIFVTNKNVVHITSNDSDANVEIYDYDYVIHNDGTLDDLELTVKNFIDRIETGPDSLELACEYIKIISFVNRKR